MSFDQTFDYTSSLTFLQKQADALQQNISGIDEEAAQLKRCCGYASITEPKLKSLEARKKLIVPRAQELAKSAQSITEIQHLNETQKATLHALFQVSGLGASEFMSKLVG